MSDVVSLEMMEWKLEQQVVRPCIKVISQRGIMGPGLFRSKSHLDASTTPSLDL
jgi:hypothetical protein